MVIVCNVFRILSSESCDRFGELASENDILNAGARFTSISCAQFVKHPLTFAAFYPKLSGNEMAVNDAHPANVLAKLFAVRPKPSGSVIASSVEQL